MNTSLSTPADSNPWKRMKLQYVTLACGLALAAAAAVSIDSEPVASRPASSSPQRSTLSAPSTRANDQLHAAIYLVRSQEDAQRAQAFEDDAAWVRHESGVFGFQRALAILVAETPSEVSRARRNADNQRATIEEAGGKVTIVDWLDH